VAVRIRPVLAIDCELFSPGIDLTEVAVVCLARVHKWLARQPACLPQDEAFRISTAARRASTWR
jgi:hypothetical protein